MNTLIKFIVVSFLIVTCWWLWTINERVDQTAERLQRLSLHLDQIEMVIDDVLDEAIIKSMPFAPKGYTRWQLRGHAQKRAQELLDKLTDMHNLPRYELTSIRWDGKLNPVTAAGSATNCYHIDEDDQPTYLRNPYDGYISLNEILFLRNYEEFMYIIIPHEVAHLFSCLNGGFVYDEDETYHEAEHGPEWYQAMKDLGFSDPTRYVFHEFDLRPVFEYQTALIKRLTPLFKKEEENVSGE